jgi:hypothetical protein
MIDLSLQKDSDLSIALEAKALLLKTDSAALWDHIQSIVDDYSPFFEGAAS